MNKLVSTLHDATHQVPGVPAHRDGQPTAQRTEHPRNSGRNPRPQNRHHQAPERHQTPPRILVAWQNWIGRHVANDNRE